VITLDCKRNSRDKQLACNIIRLMGTQIRLSQIYKSFDSSMQALYKLHIAIQDSLGEDEWKVIEGYYQEVFSLFEGYDPLEIQMILERLIQIDIEDETLNYKKIWEAINIDPNYPLKLENDREVFVKEIQDGLKEFAIHSPEKANKFFRAFLKSQREEPLKSELSRHGLLLSAASQFEFLLLHLLRAYFIYHEHDLALNDNFTIEELDDEITRRVGKRLKSFSIFEKLDFISNKFILHEGFSRNALKEIFERRNVFAHRSGRADDVYVQYNKTVKIGDRLRISQNYIKSAIEYLHLWGLVMCARVWEKLDISDQKEVGKAIATTAMQLIREERYVFCTAICQQIHDNIPFKSHNSKDILMINYAICLDKLGEEKQKMKILGGIRQSPRESVPGMKKLSSQEPFLYVIPMAVNALTGKKHYAMDLLKRAADTNQVTYLDLDYWVIFDYLANEPGFQQIREKLEAKVMIA
jgi:hypothetical protein